MHCLYLYLGKTDRDVSDADEETISDAMKLPEILDMMVMYAVVSGEFVIHSFKLFTNKDI